jgi:RNA polymerase sigma-70 factor (ECF subfamily)
MTTIAKQLDDAPASDEELVESACRGSGAAFAVLVTRYGDAVYTIARNMCPRVRDTEEVVQQSFLAAWRDLSTLPANAQFSTWLYGIAMETALAYRQRDRSEPSSTLERFLPAYDGTGRLAPGKGRWPELDDSAPARAEVSGLLREALDCADDRARAVFVLRDLLDLPADEAASILQIPPELVRRDAHQLRLKLRGFIDGL